MHSYGIGNKYLTYFRFCAIVFAFVLVSACGGGGGGGGSSSGDDGATGGADVTALSLPDRIELSNVSDNDGQAAVSGALGFSLTAFNDPGTDYTNQEKHSWVDDTDALDMVNEILGVVKDTGYENFVNQGPYKALVRQVGDSEQTQSGGSTTSTATEALMEIYVDVTRVDNESPMIVKVWVEEEDGMDDQAMLIRGYFTVSQGVSVDYPYGVMTAHFRGNALDDGGNEGDQVFTMAMSVTADGGNVVIENVEDSVEGGGFEFHRKVRVVANADVSEGNAYVSDQETDWDSGTLPDPTIMQVAFNQDHFKVTEQGQQPVIFAKDDLRHRIFRYKLFDADTGAEVALNSGFPVETQEGKHGYVGYYGLWTSHGTALNHGDTVYDMNDNAYTIFRSAGKLTKHTRDSMLLGDLTGMELFKWTQNGEVIVTWNGSQFMIIGARSPENGQIIYFEPDDPNRTATTFQQWEGAWCEALRAFLRLGNLCFDNNGTPLTPNDGNTVYFHSEQTLNPAEAADLTLYTWSFTLDLPITQTIIDNAGMAEGDYWSSPYEKVFNFAAANMMLYDEGLNNAVQLPTDIDVTGTNYQWGYHIGPLTTTRYNETNHWQAHEEEIYYTWNTGLEEWNQFTTVIDADGYFISFDAPLSFTYTHATANDVNGDSTHDGKKFRMEYDGFSVQIPWEYDENSDEWQPLINIKDGVAMGPSGNDYIIKAVEEALVMAPVADPTGIVFANEQNVGEPTLTYDASKTDLVGAVPTTALLKVIKGEVVP